MERVPSIVSIDCTQTCVLQDATSALERWSLGFNVRRDGEILKRAAAIVSTSHWTAHDIERMYPDCRTPIHVMPNPVRLDLFDRAWMDERRSRAGARGPVPVHRRGLPAEGRATICSRPGSAAGSRAARI